ncbi:BRO-N domain-containing protein [Xenophilus azovorans]|uniref:BRO-N domain-containing protein n=1 Tax=Xenophilus azovorans TaxID=151755 RepID=UPI00068F32DB|nr:Bro-N domain-containing protein [Xenophilus azovorans]
MSKPARKPARALPAAEQRQRFPHAANDPHYSNVRSMRAAPARDASTDLMNVAPLAFEGTQVRALTDEAGAAWFVAVDVARVLGFKHTPHMVRLLDDDEADVRKLDIRSATGTVQSRRVTLITESGLFAAVLRSRRPGARRFRRWVTGEVLPSLRRDGLYMIAGHAAATGLELWRMRLEVERREGISKQFASTGGRWMREHQVRTPGFKASTAALDMKLNPILTGLGIPTVQELLGQDTEAKKPRRAARKRKGGPTAPPARRVA